MKARLLDRQAIEDMSGTGNLQNLINKLVETPYRPALESALVRTSGREAIMTALHEDLVQTLNKLENFFSGKTWEFVSLALRSYDVHNIKAILRGLDKGVPGDQIARALLPVGRLRQAILDELANSDSPRDAIDRMGTMRLPLAQPLLDLRAERPGAEVFAMEVALEQWHNQDARRRLQKAPREFKYLLDALQVEADITNILTALRLAMAPQEREKVEDVMNGQAVSSLMIGPGKLSFDKLDTAAEEDLESAVERLAIAPYGEALQTGFERFQRTGRLSEIENELMRSRLSWRSKLVLKDPLGVGVILAYMALKINEVRNIRKIALGLDAGMEPVAILESLVLLP
jgi:V/A-type H+-transporting ATPase subunit C